MKINCHWKKGRVGVDVMWITHDFYILPTARFGKGFDVRYMDICFLYFLITFYRKTK